MNPGACQFSELLQIGMHIELEVLYSGDIVVYDVALRCHYSDSGFINLIAHGHDVGDTSR